VDLNGIKSTQIATREKGGLWKIIPKEFEIPEVGTSAIGNKNVTFTNRAIQHHHRFGHISLEKLKAMKQLGFIDFSSDELDALGEYKCEGCIASMSEKRNAIKVNVKSALERNVARPAKQGSFSVDLRDYGKTKTREGYRYGFKLVDRCTRYEFLVATTNKDGATAIDIFESLRQRLLAKNVRLWEIISDRESALAKDAGFQKWASENVVKLRPCTSKGHVRENALAESSIAYTKKSGKAMLFHRHMPKSFIVDAEQYATFLRNVTTHSALGGRTPWMEFKNEDFNYEILKMFGCICYDKANRTDPAKRYVFLGFDGSQNGYKCLNPKTQKVVYLNNPLFEEDDNITEAWLTELENGLTVSLKTPTRVEEQNDDAVEEEKIPSSDNEAIENSDDDLDRIEDVPEEDSGSESDENDDHVQDEEVDDDETPPVQNRTSSRLTAKSKIDYAIAGRSGEGIEHKGIGHFSKSISRSYMGMSALASRPIDDNLAIKLDQRFEGMDLSFEGKCKFDFGKRMNREEEENLSKMNGSFISEPMAGMDYNPGERHETLIPGKEYPKARNIKVPKNEAEMLLSEYMEEFVIAQGIEIGMLKDKGTFKTVPDKRGTHKLKTRYVYDVKSDAEGDVTKFKARLVVLGYGQIWGLEYDETFAPVATEATIKFQLAHSAKNGYKNVFFDYGGAFLHSDMDVILHIECPPGLDLPPGTMVLLVKSLYGTKQAGLLWNKDLTASLKKMGFKQSKYDPCLFTRVESGEESYVVLWVDDVILSTNLSQQEIDDLIWLIRQLGFTLSTVGDLEFYLGMKIEFDGKGRVRLSQKAYIETILNRFNMADCKGVKAPMNSANLPSKADLPDLDTAEGRSEWEELKKFPMRQAIGSLLHLARWTRPDLKFAVGYHARYQILYGAKHVKGVKRMFRYLKETIEEGVTFGGSDIPLVMFVDADYAMDPDQRKSTTGFVALFYGGAGTSKSKKQPIIADSTTVAELVALSDASREAKWLSWLIAEFGVSPNYRVFEKNIKSEVDPVKIYEDNNGVISISKHQMVSQRTKHVEIRYFIVQELVATQIVVVLRVDTTKNLADVFTKALSDKKHWEMAQWLFKGVNPMEL